MLMADVCTHNIPQCITDCSTNGYTNMQSKEGLYCVRQMLRGLYF